MGSSARATFPSNGPAADAGTRRMSRWWASCEPLIAGWWMTREMDGVLAFSGGIPTIPSGEYWRDGTGKSQPVTNGSPAVRTSHRINASSDAVWLSLCAGARYPDTHRRPDWTAPPGDGNIPRNKGCCIT